MKNNVKHTAGYYLVCLLLFITFSTNGQPRDTLKVLFVGNSYTYFWNMPQTVEAMAASQRIPLLVRQSTAGGMSLEDHWNGKKELKSKTLISEGDWDIVVLQNHSMSAIEAEESFMEYGKRFIQLVRESGAEPMLYMTWARKFNPLMQHTISEAYEKLGSASGAEVVPVGLIWSKVRELRPELNLFDPDGSHPSPEGSYLIATAFFKAITKNNTLSLPQRLTSTDENGEKIYLAIMSENDANFIQQAVEEFEFVEDIK